MNNVIHQMKNAVQKILNGVLTNSCALPVNHLFAVRAP